ncbi:beta-N-acetylglucosaminidase domain-containing protein [Actinopolymorpha singaporensis]|uniref:Hyaluronoglucosaminidase n=1 Tax=Actinopolymorpha singaporensis TaxID=117157 RepID=A0A1H1RC32_9ACTN|nr:beta-N-acetylglucosaminidase domain-containing protein [Actinopolymorpha singaporensis]SDS33076.1 hyaluronoglucosaminidase [Actinopolymorpha singaporensis]
MAARLRAALTMLAVAVLVPMSGAVPSASAVPKSASVARPPAGSVATPDVPRVWPTPQRETSRDDGFPITPVVGLVRGRTTDAAAEKVVRGTLTRAGVKDIVATDGRDPHTPVTVWLGGGAEVLAKLGVDGPSGLPAEGYVLATGRTPDDRKHVVLGGVDVDGTYYAAQTLRQLVRPHAGLEQLPGVAIRDWPSMRYRGSIEGFYGTPYTQADRLDHVDYLGAHKMNTYEYAPKDDPFHRERWRDPYPADKLAELGTLVDRARRNHVDFTFALSPGLSICYSSKADLDALLAKFDAIYALGGRSFNVPLDDIDYNTWHCDEDPAKFGTGAAGAGKAQAYLLNRVQAWVDSKGDVAPLQMVPTEYYNTTESPYKKAVRENLDPHVVVHWTGVGVVPTTITNAQAAAARKVFGHQVLVWDNYPVNDYIAGRLPLGPYTGRERGLSEHVVGVISNPSNQAATSKPALFSFADFSWHDATFDDRTAWEAALNELAGGDAATAAALRVFADVSTYDGTLHKTQAPELRQRIDTFWSAWQTGDRAAAIATLRAYVRSLGAAPSVIRAGVTDPRFVPEAAAWLDATELWAKAGLTALDMLDAQEAGDGARAWRDRQQIAPLIARAKAIRDSRAPHNSTYPRIADGVLDKFIADAEEAGDHWLGLTKTRPVPTTTLGTYADNAPERMVDGDPGTFYWTDGPPSPGDLVGVDLRAVHEIGDVAVLMSKSSSPNDYIHTGLLEYSADGRSWTTLTTGTTAEVRATAPAGTSARYVRYRATGGNDGYWLVVREFSVEVRDSQDVTYSVSGGPPAAEGSSLRAAADSDVDAWYRAARSPAEGDALLVTASQSRPLADVVVLSSADARATVQVRDGSGRWRTLGTLAPDFTELSAGGLETDAIRLVWSQGAPPPEVAEIIFRYAGGGGDAH